MDMKLKLQFKEKDCWIRKKYLMICYLLKNV